MTYPPQPPDPYGQQPWGRPGPQGPPGGGYGGGRHSGGYPQQPGGYPPPSGAYPQQQPGGWQQPGYLGGEPPEPPRKRTGLIVGIVVAALLLIGAVAVTGFWKPGFFLADDKSTSESKPTQPATQPPTGTAEPTTEPAQTGDNGSSDDAAQVEQIAETVVKGLNEKDAATVKPVSCSPDKERQSDYDGFPDGITWTVDGSASVNDDEATIGLKAKSDSGEQTATLDLKKVNGTWCAASVK